MQFKTLEGKLAAYLPKDAGVNLGPDKIEHVEVVLRVKSAGTRFEPRDDERWSGRPGTRFRFGPDRVVEYTIGPRRTTDPRALARRLEQLHRADPSRPLAVDARRGIVVDEVIRVVDTALELGFGEVLFEGSHE